MVLPVANALMFSVERRLIQVKLLEQCRATAKPTSNFENLSRVTASTVGKFVDGGIESWWRAAHSLAEWALSVGPDMHTWQLPC